MSDYSEIWEEMHRGKIEQEKKAEMCRKKIAKKLSVEEMVRLIFMRFLREIPDYEIIELYNKFPHEES